MDETGASQSSSPNYVTGEKQGIQAGHREEGGRQTGRVNPEAGRGEANGRAPEAEAKRELNAVINPRGSGEEHGCPEDCVWLCWDVWVYLLTEIAQHLHHRYLIY